MNQNNCITISSLGRFWATLLILFCLNTESAEYKCKSVFEETRAQKILNLGKTFTSNIKTQVFRLKLDNKLKKMNKSIDSVSIKEIVDLGIELNPLVFDALYIPKEAREFYDSSTGTFNYQVEKPLVLREENGDAPLERLQINVWSRSGLGDAQILMGLEALKKLPELEVNIQMRDKIYRDGKKLKKKLNMGKSFNDRLTIEEAKGSRVFRFAQDTFLAIKEKGIMAPSYSAKKDIIYKLSVDHLVKTFKENTDVWKSPFQFEGGNVIVGDKHVFVGYEVIRDSAELLRISNEEVLRGLEKEFGKPIIPIGVRNQNNEIKQVDYHLDLTMAVVRNRNTGKEEILIGSSEKAYELLMKDGKGDPSLRVGLKNTLWNPLIKDRENRMKVVAKELEDMGYKVSFLPNLFNDRLISRTNILSKLIKPYNYTNVLLGHGEVLLSSFGIKKLDDYAFNKYRELGYEPVDLIHGNVGLMYYSGVRCSFCSVSKETNIKGLKSN